MTCKVLSPVGPCCGVTTPTRVRTLASTAGALGAVASLLAGCGAMTVGLVDGGTTGNSTGNGATTASATGGPAGVTTGSTVGTSAGTSASSGSNGTTTGGSIGGSTGTTGGGISSTTTTGGTTSNLPSCGDSLSCFGDQCLFSDCNGAPRDATCGLADGGQGVCAGGVCQTPPQGNDDGNCGYFGATCPVGSNCYQGVCFLDGGSPDESCTGAECAFGRQCQIPDNVTVVCVLSDCSPGHDDQTCAGDGGLIGSCCDSACVDTNVDTNNCGGCGIACGTGAVCQGSPFDSTPPTCLATSCSGLASGTACALGNAVGTCCGGTCTSLLTDTSNCGVCGMSCPTPQGFQCSNGSCQQLDDAGFPIYCDPTTAPCPSGFTCAATFATCEPDCSVAPDGVPCGESLANYFVEVNFQRMCCNHQCVDLELDPANCSACGVACDGGQACDLGICVRTDCTLATADFAPCPLPDGGGGVCCGGACTNPLADALNCGACRIACGNASSCEFGFCQLFPDAGSSSPCGGTCPTGTLCDPGRNNCLPTACGANDTNGLCAYRYDAGGMPAVGTSICCGGACVDSSSDSNNCTGCGLACGVDSVCADGYCGTEGVTCGSGADTQCAAGLTCVSQIRCASTSCTGQIDGETCLFGANALNITFGTGVTLGVCCAESCVDLTQDPQNCGACGVSVPTGLCVSRSGQNQNDCIDQACADLSSDPLHCGNCAIACPAGQTCSGGTCSGSPTCVPGKWGAFCDLDAGLDDAGMGAICCPGLGCVDVSNDSANCGSCGVVCSSGHACVLGFCQ